MSSIFRKDDNYVDKPKRNAFDMSFQNNLTTKFGEIIPVLCQPVYPGDSVKIDPKFALRYMPQVFPVQTRQRASVKYYYVRNRNLWKDWPDFIGKTKTGLVPPYVQFGEKEHFYYLRPSSIADYLNWPIKIEVPYGSDKTFALNNVDFNQGTDYTYIPNSDVVLSNGTNEPFAIVSRKNISKVVAVPRNTTNDALPSVNFKLSDIYGATENSVTDGFAQPLFYLDPDHQTDVPMFNVNFALYRKPWKFQNPLYIKSTTPINISSKQYLIVRDLQGVDYAIPFTATDGGSYVQITSPRIKYNSWNGTSFDAAYIEVLYVVGVMRADLSSPVRISVTDHRVNVKASENDGLCWCDVSTDDLPFASTKHPDRLRMSALPFRAIESIYNALIRNAENNPFMIDGVPEYNKYITKNDGGETSPWPIMETMHCNWSDDRFTTALPSPQQGNAPLVGLTGVNGAVVNLANADGTNTSVHLQVDSDTGNVVMVDSVQGSDNNPALTHAFMSAVDYGITINDLRNVNSFQRWLENNIRRGYKYKDQLMAHYGVNARYDVLDMPEFIGGVSRDVNVEQVTQMATTDQGTLGEYGGQSYIMGEGRSIEHYCDEHGFIIGLMSVYPMPIYQDTLPKYFTAQDPFDYYFPEFSKIGMQAITNKELAFSQSVVADDMDGTFGYQRAWYDMLENLDQVHGEFRFDLRNFLIGRDFSSMPKLNADFLTISADDLNNTFYSDDDKDKIIGQIYQKMSMKRPVPITGIAALE